MYPKNSQMWDTASNQKKGYKSEKLGNEVYMYMEQMEDASRLKRKHLNYVQNKNAVACEVHDAWHNDSPTYSLHTLTFQLPLRYGIYLQFIQELVPYVTSNWKVRDTSQSSSWGIWQCFQQVDQPDAAFFAQIVQDGWCYSATKCSKLNFKSLSKAWDARHDQSINITNP